MNSQGTQAHLSFAEQPNILHGPNVPHSRCQACSLGGPHIIQVDPRGNSAAEIVFIGMAPAAEEERSGLVFQGKAGKILNEALSRVGFNPDNIFLLNAVCCRPPANREPTAEEIRTCRELYLVPQIKAHPRKLLVCLGAHALYSIFPQGNIPVISKKRGIIQASKEFGCSAMGTYHPMAIGYQPGLYSTFISDLQRAKQFAEDNLNPHTWTSVILAEQDSTQFFQELNQQSCVAVDVETDGLIYPKNTTRWPTQILLGASFAWDKDFGIYIPLLHPYWNSPEIKQRFLDWWIDPSKTKTLQAGKFDALVMRRWLGAFPKGYKYDTCLMYHLLNEYGELNLESMAMSFVNFPAWKTHFRQNLLPPLIVPPVDLFRLASHDALAQYCIGDSIATLLLTQILHDRLKTEQLDKLFSTLIMPMQHFLIEMEWHGILIDAAKLQALDEQLHNDLDSLLASIHQIAGESFNPRSHQQLSNLLFTKMGLPSLHTTATGQPSTDKENLEAIRSQHHIIDLILRFRETDVFHNTFVHGCQNAIQTTDNRIHADFMINGSESGRIICRHPNLQNIPRDRKLPFCAPPGYCLIYTDLSQTELRFLAAISNDATMKQDINSGDFHKQLAATIFGIPTEDVTQKQRFIAKTLLYASLYGQGPQSLSKMLNITVNKAQQFLTALFQRYPQAAAWMSHIRDQIQRGEPLVDFWGRKRRVLEIRSSDQRIKHKALREGINAPVQGGAAWVLNYKLLRLWQPLKDLGCQTVNIIHDAFLVECPTKHSEQVCQLIQQEIQTDIPGLDISWAGETKIVSSN